MIVEIHGAGFQNKGAELMLRTATAELRQRLPDLIPAIDPHYGSYEQRGQLGLRQVFPTRSTTHSPNFPSSFRRQKLFSSVWARTLPLWGRSLQMYGCVPVSAVDALVDIAGFAYSDQWGDQVTANFAEIASYYKSRGLPVILLPQAFGPFNSSGIRAAFSKLLQNSELVYARDRQSYNYVNEFSEASGKLFLCPDITFFHPKRMNLESTEHQGYVCIVPNTRLLDKGKQEWGNKYQMMLMQIVSTLVLKGISVKMLVFDTGGGYDLSLVSEIYRDVKSELPSADLVIVEEQNPLALKKIIGVSYFLVGSRFHSLISAFANSVPSIALGWSHKYQMLFEEFDVKHLIISPETSLQQVNIYLEELLDPNVNLRYRKQISSQLRDLQINNENMWDTVASVLEKQMGTV